MLDFQLCQKKEADGLISYTLLKRRSPNKRSLNGHLALISNHPLQVENRTVDFYQNNGFKKIIAVSGWRLELIHHYLKEILKSNGNTQVKPREGEVCFHIGEESGVRLHLLLLSITNIVKKKKIEQLLGCIRALSPEEVYYWYAKISDPSLNGRGLKAFRILMTD